MINIFVAFFLAAAINAQAPTATTDRKDSEDLSQLERIWNEAHLKGVAEALDRLWADDLVVTVPEMPRLNKTQSLAIWKTGKFKFDRYQTSDLRIQLYGDAAVVTGRLQRTRRMGDRKIDDDWLFTKFYVHARDGWQVAAFHASPAPQDQKPENR